MDSEKYDDWNESNSDKDLSKSDDSFFQKSNPTVKSNQKSKLQSQKSLIQADYNMPKSRFQSRKLSLIGENVASKSIVKQTSIHNIKSESNSSKKMIKMSKLANTFELYKNVPLDQWKPANSSEKESAKAYELDSYNNEMKDPQQFLKVSDANLGKMSKISEEEYQVHIGTPYASNERRSSNAYMTTNENIEQYKNSQKQLSAMEYQKYSSPQVDRFSQAKSVNVQNQMAYADHSKGSKVDILSDQSDNKSLSITKGRFTLKTIPNDLMYEHLEEPAPLSYGVNNDIRYNKQIVRIDALSSSDKNNPFPLQNYNSNPEYSMKDRSDTGTARNWLPFGQDVNPDIIPYEEGLNSGYNKMDNFGTPIFTMNTNSRSQYNVMPQRPIPSLSFERVNDNRFGENGQNSMSSSNFTEKEVKGSPRNSLYFNSQDGINKNQNSLQYQGLPAHQPENINMHRQDVNQYPWNYIPPQYPNMVQNMPSQTHDQLQFMSNAFRTMQEYQSMQFQCMLNSHTQIMDKLIGCAMGMGDSNMNSNEESKVQHRSKRSKKRRHKKT